MQSWQDHEQKEANDIADNEAKYVQEIFGFLYLLELAQEEELPGAVKPVNKACWEIEMARQVGGIEVNHPGEGETTRRTYDTHCSSFFEGFNYSDYGSTPEDEVPPQKSDGKEDTQGRTIDPSDPVFGF